MKIFMSDSVAPEFLPLLRQHGDFAAAAIAFSAQRSPEFWNSLLAYVRYCAVMKDFFTRLRRENRPLKREWLIRIKAFAAKFDDDVRVKPSLYLRSVYAGIEAWSVYIPEYTGEIIVDILDERGRRVERFRLPVAP
jgi:hypothetical protein